MLYTEKDSNYIVYGCIGYDLTSVANRDNFLTFMSIKIYPALVMGLTNCSYNDTLEIGKKVTNSNKVMYYKDNVCYYFVTHNSNSNISYMYVNAITKSKYKEFSK